MLARPVAALRGGGVGARATARTRVPGWLLMGGTSTSWLLDLLVGSTPGFGRGGILCLVGGWLGTLLGPEGTGAGRGAGVLCSLGRCRGEPLLVVSGWVWGVGA